MVLLLYKFTIYSFFLIILENIWQSTAAEIDQNYSDGEQFIEKVINGEKTAFERPEYLLFTAPYKICEGECSNNEDNFAIEFPLYIGKKGLGKYTDFYRRDHQKVHSGRPNAPLRKRSTKKLFTLCATSICTTTTSTERTEPSTEEDNLTTTTQETDNVTEESLTTNLQVMKIEEDQITESNHDTEPDMETSDQITESNHDTESEMETSTQTVTSTSNLEKIGEEDLLESATQMNHDTESETPQTNSEFSNETIQTQPTDIETEPQTESTTNAELTIEMFHNGTLSENFTENGETSFYPSEIPEKQTIESQTPSKSTLDDNEIQENTQTGENAEMTEEQDLGDELKNAKESTQLEKDIEIPGGIQYENDLINSKENTYIEEITVYSEKILQHENESIGSIEKAQIEENMDSLDETQYENELMNSKENIQTMENTEVTGGIEHVDDSKTLPNNSELNDVLNNFLYNPTNQSGLNNYQSKLKFKMETTSHSNREAYNQLLLFRPMFTAITNTMGEMCPYYVCSKKVKPDTDLNKLGLTTETIDHSYRDVTDKHVKLNENYYDSRRRQNEIEENLTFEHQRDNTAANAIVQLNQREDQINESEEFPSYSDDNDGKLRVQSNAEDEFESYSDDTYEDKTQF